jgi:hypothetical protein
MTFYDINDSDRVSKKSNIRQLVDILQADIASKDDAVPTSNALNTRKKYEVFKAGGLGETEVVSSLYQTVFDQDHTYQTSNEMLDITIGSHSTSTTVTSINNDPTTGLPDTDSSGKMIFPSTSLMMREKIAIYRQYAQILLGDTNGVFYAPFDADVSTDTVAKAEAKIEDAVFINFKRLFVRDGMEKEQFSIKIHKECPSINSGNDDNIAENIDSTNSNFLLYSDANAKSNLNVSTVSGHVGSLVDDSDNKVGLVFYNKGIVVLDAQKVFNTDDIIKGTISATDATKTDFNSAFIPYLWQSGSIDNIVDHICDTRFGRENKSAIGFINQTSINSTLYFCRVGPNDANFSTNPTYTDDDGNIRCIQNKGDDPFSYITTIGLYDASGELLAVAKTSRPIEKNPEVDLSISVRLDY